ncbi:MAG TPA: AAA family ATPase [Acidimicrobiales bacterium]|nr:AAA family ATPase [Acidimicrobiales bacterium]
MALTFPEALQRLAPAAAPLAGRWPELTQLRGMWEQATLGRGAVVLIAGEAGVGKTRLAAELAFEAEATGGIVMVGSCPADGGEPYAVLSEALGRLRLPRATAGGDRDAFFAAIVEDVGRRSRRAPVLALLDDLHAADRSTVLAIRRLAQAAASAAVLIVGTFRDNAVDHAHPLAELLNLPGVTRVNLDGLGAVDLARIYGDDELGARLWRWSGGNPVVAGELLRLPRLDQADLPARLDDLVARRIDDLPATARRVLRMAAVAGTAFPVALVAAAAELSPDRTAAALDRAAAAGFLVTEVAAGGRRRFVHDMIRESVERGTEPSTRIRLHRRLARALEEADPQAPPALLAWHFRAAAPVGASAAVVRHSTRAGDRAMELLAWEQAEVHYGHALAAAATAPPATRADLLLSLGEAQRLAGETARARQAFLEAAGVARRARDGARLARAALALGQVAAVWGADPVLESLAVEARAMLGQAPAVAPTAPAAPVVARVDFASGELYDVLDGVVRPPEPEPAPTTPPPAPVARAPRRPGDGFALLRARYAALAGPERSADRLVAADAMVAMAVDTGDENQVAEARGRRFLALLELGRLADAEFERSAHAALVARLDRPALAYDVATWAAMRALVDGRPAVAGAASEEALALGGKAGDPGTMASFLVQRWESALEWGTAEELVTVADECDVLAAAGGTAYAARAMAALALARAGQDELAAEELRRVAGRGLGTISRDPERLHPLVALAEVAWTLGDARVAGAVGPLLDPLATQSVVVGRGLAWRGSAARACALCAAANGRWDDAARYIQLAVAAHRRAGALPLVARARYEESTILTGRGRRSDRRHAAEAAREASELADRFAMTWLGEALG